MARRKLSVWVETFHGMSLEHRRTAYRAEAANVAEVAACVFENSPALAAAVAKAAMEAGGYLHVVYGGNRVWSRFFFFHDDEAYLEYIGGREADYMAVHAAPTPPVTCAEDAAAYTDQGRCSYCSPDPEAECVVCGRNSFEAKGYKKTLTEAEFNDTCK
jgi:hypothetical protein